MAGISITLAGNFTKLDELKDKAKKTASSIKSEFEKFSKTDTFKGLAVGATAAFAAIAYGAKEAVMAASDLGENIAKTGQVFKGSTDDILRWADTAADSFGLSKNSALEAASSMGNLFTAMGLVPDKAADMSKRMVELSADLASFNNTSIEEALEAIGSALRGEAEPIQRFGVLMNDATLQAKALAMGISNGKDTLTPANKAMAAYGLILEQTKTAQGDFARTSDGFANSMRTIKALTGDTAAEIGQVLLPEVEKGAKSLREFLQSVDFQSVGAGIADMTQKIVGWGEALGKILDKAPLVIAMRAAMEGLFGGAPDPAKAKAMAEEWAKNDPDYMKSGAQRAATKAAQEAAPATPPKTAAELKKEADEAEKAAKAAKEKAEAEKKAAEERERTRAAAVEEYNIESRILSARLKGDEARLAALLREKAIREEMKKLESAGFTLAEARRPAEAKVDAEKRAADLEDSRRKEADAKEQAKEDHQRAVDALQGKLADVRSRIDDHQFQSSIGSISSMQRIGGGGGAVGSGLDYARQAADLQREANSYLRQLTELARRDLDV